MEVHLLDTTPMFLCFKKVSGAPSVKKKKGKFLAEIMENQGGNDFKRLHNILKPQRAWAGEESTEACGTLGVYH